MKSFASSRRELISNVFFTLLFRQQWRRSVSREEHDCMESSDFYKPPFLRLHILASRISFAQFGPVTIPSSVHHCRQFFLPRRSTMKKYADGRLITWTALRANAQIVDASIDFCRERWFPMGRRRAVFMQRGRTLTSLEPLRVPLDGRQFRICAARLMSHPSPRHCAPQRHRLPGGAFASGIAHLLCRR